MLHLGRVRNVLVLLALAGCGSSSTDAAPSPAPSTQATTAPTSSATPAKDAGASDGGGPHGASEALRRCAESKGEVRSITEAVTRLNSLIAKGGDGACFVATLPRPLAVVATFNKASAQPAGGLGAPRIFLMLPKLVITAVPDGEGSKVLEFGEWTGSTSTLKGEVALPVTAPLAADAAFTRILQTSGNTTTCGSCHGAEDPHPTIAKAFISDALRPSNEVSLPELEELHRLCIQAGTTGERCDFIHALFDFGEITQGAFSPAVRVFN